MPRKKGYAGDPTHAPLNAENRAALAARQRAERPDRETSYGTGRTALEMLASLDHGNFRLSSHPWEDVCYLKWKWTHGGWADHYYMVSGHPNDIEALALTLLDRIDACDRGICRPTRDRFYNGR